MCANRCLVPGTECVNLCIWSQIYPDGIRHIRSDKRVNEWKTPGKKIIDRCAVNMRQVVIALTGGELVYFEMDPVRLFNTSFSWIQFVSLTDHSPYSLF